MVQGSSSGLFCVPGFGGTRTDPRPYCPRPPWQLPNHVTLYLNTHGHSPELTAPLTILMLALAYLLSLKKSFVLLMGLINVTDLNYMASRTISTKLAPNLETRYFIKCCGLDHCGSEPFNYYYHSNGADSSSLPFLFWLMPKQYYRQV